MLNKKCYILDLDGTVYLGDIPIQGTIDFILSQSTQTVFYFLSNNTSKSSLTYLNKLAKFGIIAQPWQLLSPITPLLDYLQSQNISRIYPVGNQDFLAELHNRNAQLIFTDKDPQAVVLAYDTELTYAKLATAALLLQNPQIQYLATHPDLVCPTPAGPIPDVGSFIALLATATKRTPSQIFGKPDPAVLAPVLQKYAKEDLVMVGDRLSTDKLLAENAGIDFILVLSGEAKLEEVQGMAKQPQAIVNHLSELKLNNKP